MHGLMSYRRFGRALGRYVATELRLELGRYVATLFELLSNDSRFLRKAFRKEESISKSICRRRFLRFLLRKFGLNFVATVFDPNNDLMKKSPTFPKEDSI
ncbi:hypothetical protein F2Q69_00027707 [Brassica cretica]|uniref:Uncharacterized protein n=1 Tax=Brassica cretica TaxID=69181 RepID=A0A8S9RUN2_BRACR|nr:hypothetical protein F2Q69_00027707 [Brassica cretica]